MLILISQIVGFCAFIIFVISMQQKNKITILFLQIISFFLYTLQYLLISAYSGMIVYIINMTRSIVFYYTIKKGNIGIINLIIFIIISLICGVATYKNIYDVLPMIASVLSVIFTWQPSTKILRSGQVSICILWIIYDVFVMAYIGILTESLIIISTVISLLKNDYNVNIAEIIYKKYIKIRFNAKDEDINLSHKLPLVKKWLLKSKKI